jgi:hypothetical protein
MDESLLFAHKNGNFYKKGAKNKQTLINFETFSLKNSFIKNKILTVKLLSDHFLSDNKFSYKHKTFSLSLNKIYN